jgi:hypothetical protein
MGVCLKPISMPPFPLRRPAVSCFPSMSYPALWIVALLGCSVCLPAQDPADGVTQSDTDTPNIESGTQPIYTPLSLKQKWLYSVSQIFGPSRLAAYAVSAAYDQIYDVPKQWGGNGESLSERLASHFGDSFIRNNIQFGVQALDHEDPRYPRSSLHGGWNRTRYAIVHTFVVPKDNGTWMPAYSLLVTSFGTPYIISQWRPERFRSMNGPALASLGISVRLGSDIFSEFWPDLKKKLATVPALRRHIAFLP